MYGIITKTGEVRYRFVVDMGRKPDGSRDQRGYTYDKLGEARTRLNQIKADRSHGVLVKPTKITVAEAITAWLNGRRNLRESSRRSYADSLKLVSERLGHVELQKASPRTSWTPW